MINSAGDRRIEMATAWELFCNDVGDVWTNLVLNVGLAPSASQELDVHTCTTQMLARGRLL